jgi:rfaE bifunctional protein kinase chain/domain
LSARPELPDLRDLRVAVAGDVVVDHYLLARPRRLSREAPVMVLRHLSDSRGAGGAANVARNLRALGAGVSLFAVAGRDTDGRELARLLDEEGIQLADLVHAQDWTTPTKTRVLAAEARRFPQQVLRIDREPDEPVPPELRADIARRLSERAAELDALVVSDYEYGLVGEELGLAAGAISAQGKPVVLDPRAALEPFRGLTALTPNVGELARFTGADPERLDREGELRAAAAELLARAECRWLLVTRGNLGMALFGEGLPREGVTVAASGHGDVTDVSGAGDTAAAVFALALAADVDPVEAMVLANAASGVVVMENGTAVCTGEQLRAALADTPAPNRGG